MLSEFLTKNLVTPSFLFNVSTCHRMDWIGVVDSHLVILELEVVAAPESEQVGYLVSLQCFPRKDVALFMPLCQDLGCMPPLAIMNTRPLLQEGSAEFLVTWQAAIPAVVPQTCPGSSRPVRAIVPMIKSYSKRAREKVSQG